MIRDWGDFSCFMIISLVPTVLGKLAMARLGYERCKDPKTNGSQILSSSDNHLRTFLSSFSLFETVMVTYVLIVKPAPNPLISLLCVVVAALLTIYWHRQPKYMMKIDHSQLAR